MEEFSHVDMSASCVMMTFVLLSLTAIVFGIFVACSVWSMRTSACESILQVHFQFHFLAPTNKQMSYTSCWPLKVISLQTHVLFLQLSNAKAQLWISEFLLFLYRHIEFIRGMVEILTLLSSSFSLLFTLCDS